LRELAAERPSLFGGVFGAPVMVLRESALENNLAAMAGYCSAHGVLLAPHGKTTCAPQLFARQLEHGAWGITVATLQQVALCRAFGVRRVLLGNELVDPGAIAWVVDELRRDEDFEFLCYVDSVEGVERISSVAGASAGRGVDVLVEMGFEGGRSGCRTPAQAAGVAAAAAAAPGITVVGVSVFEGTVGHDITDDVLGGVRDLLGRMRETASALVARGLCTVGPDGLILSAGGSMFFDVVTDVLSPPLPDGTAVQCIVRSGCYVTHDEHLYGVTSPFARDGADPRWRLRPAIEVWSEVWSRPEPGLALVGMGRRDVAFDAGLPVPRQLFRPGSGRSDVRGLTVTGLNDQHGFVQMPDGADLRVGDWLGCGINHPCTQFDKWRVIPVVDDDYRVLDFVRTFF
jgi:D-serine deaminase-like pyridoxal phosphate-dependent protein